MLEAGILRACTTRWPNRLRGARRSLGTPELALYIDFTRGPACPLGTGVEEAARGLRDKVADGLTRCQMLRETLVTFRREPDRTVIGGSDTCRTALAGWHHRCNVAWKRFAGTDRARTAVTLGWSMG